MTRRFRRLTGCLLAAMLSIGALAEAQEVPSSLSRAGRFVLGAGLGLQADTLDDTVFAFGFSGDYYLTSNFSLGPLMQIGTSSDLFQFGLSAQAKYTFDIPEFPALKPHLEAGIGFLYADLDRPGVRGGDDTSFLVPLGVGFEYRFNPRLSLDTTLLFNFTDLNVRGGDDNFFLTWLIGVRIPF
jgi:hypothetical protein